MSQLCIPTIDLNDGNRMPCIGLGTFQGTYDFSDDQLISAVTSALDIGYRHFDAATFIRTERAVGQAINMYIKSGKVKRDEVYITTKLWCTSHRKEDVVPALRKSLDTLQLDYVDMYMVHAPSAISPGSGDWCPGEENQIQFEDDKVTLMDTWRGMETCKDLKLTRSIGVCSFNSKQIQHILDNCKYKPANLQVECHPFLTQEKLHSFCRTNNITMTCFSPLGKPCRPGKKTGDPDVMTDPVLNEIGSKYNKTAGQVALRFQIQRGNVVVPKSNSPERQAENINIFDFKLTNDEMATISQKCNRNFRIVLFQGLIGSTQYPFANEIDL